MKQIKLLLVTLALGFLGGAFFWFRVTHWGSSLSQETVQNRFLSFATTLSGSRKFQFATLQQNEVFEKTSSATLFWNTVSLPDVVVKASVPVQYTYTLNLVTPWEFKKEKDRWTVTVPIPEPNEPSANLSELRFEVQGSLFRQEKPVVDGLQAAMMETLRARAKDNLPLVRETGRKETAQFLRDWFKKTYPSEKETDIQVRFHDEGPELVHTP